MAVYSDDDSNIWCKNLCKLPSHPNSHLAQEPMWQSALQCRTFILIGTISFNRYVIQCGLYLKQQGRMRPLDLDTRAPNRKASGPKKKEPIAKPIKVASAAAADESLSSAPASSASQLQPTASSAVSTRRRIEVQSHRSKKPKVLIVV